VCAAGTDQDDFLETAVTHQIGLTVAADPIAAGQTYTTTITTNNCAPASNAEHTILFVAGTGGQTYEVLNYGGDITAGAVVI
jgi:hypothetical protein